MILCNLYKKNLFPVTGHIQNIPAYTVIFYIEPICRYIRTYLHIQLQQLQHEYEYEILSTGIDTFNFFLQKKFLFNKFYGKLLDFFFYTAKIN